MRPKHAMVSPPGELPPSLLPDVLAAVDSPLVVTDRSGTIVYVNDAFTELTGYSRQEAVGGTPQLLKSGVHPPDFYEHMWSTILAGDEWRGQVVNRRKDGSLYTDEMRIVPIKGPGGAEWFVAVKRDVSARSEMLTAASPTGIFQADAGGRWRYANPRALELLGISFDDALDDGWLDAVAPSDRPDVAAAWRDAVADGRPTDVKFETVHRAKRLHLRLVPTLAAAGQTMFAGSVEDVTLLVQTATALEQSESRYRALLQHASDVIAVVTTDLRLAFVSPAAGYVLGVPPQIAAGIRIDEFVHPDDLGAVTTPDDRPVEVRLRHVDGTYRPFEVDVTLVGGMECSYVVTAREVTERRSVTDRLQHNATRDRLTGLPNRRALESLVRQRLRLRRPGQAPGALLFCRVDGIGAVRRDRGDEAGDELLVKVATRLVGAVRARPGHASADIVTRLDEDGFGVFLAGTVDLQTARNVAVRVVRFLELPFELHHGREHMAVSVAVALVDGSTVDLDELTARAERAVYGQLVEGRALEPGRFEPAASGS
jgi:PAS domain S-box-containing protein/diguanylate cyclase (GGDEF)-like protein